MDYNYITVENPDVENEHEIVFRRSPGSRTASLVGGLVGLVVVAVCAVILHLGTHFAGGKADSYAFGIGGATFLASLFGLSSAGPDETIFNLDARTYRARRYRPWQVYNSVAPRTGIPFWGQTLTGPLDDIQGLVTYSSVQRSTTDYCLAVTWKDSRRKPVFLKSGVLQDDIEALGARIAKTLGVGSSSNVQVQVAVISESPKKRR